MSRNPGCYCAPGEDENGTCLPCLQAWEAAVRAHYGLPPREPEWVWEWQYDRDRDEWSQVCRLEWGRA